MSISSTYTELLMEKILKDLLSEGTIPTVSEITSQLDAFLADNDLTRPLFSADSFKVTTGEASSKTKYNNMSAVIQRDLKVLFTHLLKVSDKSINYFERWKAEARLLERQLNTVSDRISNLLLLSQDTEGYFNYVEDNFSDMSKTELSATTAYVNTDKQLLTLGTNNAGATRVNLSSLTDEDIVFTVLSRNNLISRLATNGSKLKNVVNDASNFWHERVLMSAPGIVSTELRIDLKAITEISRIDVDLHMSNENSQIRLTPMYSTDDHNYSQLPITNYSRLVSDRSSFQFSAVEARYVKFIMTKPGFDTKNDKGQYYYEFGVDETSFFNEGFEATTSSDTGSIFISKPLYVNGTDGQPQTFTKLALEACEFVPEGTSISYSVVVSNSSEVPYSNSAFVSLDPINRAEATKATTLSFGAIGTATISGVSLSYNPTEASYTNPARHFSIIQAINGSTATVASGLASAQRYSFQDSADRILSHTIASGVSIDQGSFEVWRNVVKRGTPTEVRGYPCGWGFDDPWYTTTVYTDNADGVSIDFGGKNILIDEEAYNGRVEVPLGSHAIKVHKDNWKEITEKSATSLSVLKAADPLYPYNHRYLIEGYSYPTNYSSTDEKIYRGFDIVAEYKMKRISPSELINSKVNNNLGRFALDLDALDTSRTIDGAAVASGIHTAGNNVILVKVDESNPDFVDEDYLIKIKSSDTRYKYLRAKMVLKTTDTSIAPAVDSYRIKIAG